MSSNNGATQTSRPRTTTDKLMEFFEKNGTKLPWPEAERKLGFETTDKSYYAVRKRYKAGERPKRASLTAAMAATTTAPITPTTPAAPTKKAKVAAKRSIPKESTTSKANTPITEAFTMARDLVKRIGKADAVALINSL